MLLTGTVIAASESDKVAWIGAAARARLGQAENSIAWLYTKHPDESAAPETSLEWTRKAARYGVAAAMTTLGQAAMTRVASDLTYLDGMAFFAMGLREDLLSGTTLEMQIKLLEPEQRDELADAVAKWERIAQEKAATTRRVTLCASRPCG